MKTVTTAILMITLLAAAGCSQEETSETDPGQTVEPPRVSLHVAALQGNNDAIKQHIEAGSDLNAKDAYGSTPLIIAATFGKTGVATALIEAGADLQLKSNDGATPLHVAAFLCRTEIVEALLANGVDKSVVDATGATALESVAGPFDDVKVYYDGIGKALEPLGLELDYERIEQTRPIIAEMLR
jgi:ankyrin repeat protein